MNRPGGQKQFIDAPLAHDTDARTLSQTLERLRANLAKNHTLDSMARLAKMSKRTFARRFQAATGTTPHRWLQKKRVRRVQDLLETTALSLDQIAPQAGFSDPQTLRLHFERVVGTPPPSTAAPSPPPPLPDPSRTRKPRRPHLPVS